MIYTFWIFCWGWIPIKSMGLVYLARFTIKINIKSTIHVGKYTIFTWILWDISSHQKKYPQLDDWGCLLIIDWLHRIFLVDFTTAPWQLSVVWICPGPWNYNIPSPKNYHVPLKGTILKGQESSSNIPTIIFQGSSPCKWMVGRRLFSFREKAYFQVRTC